MFWTLTTYTKLKTMSMAHHGYPAAVALAMHSHMDTICIAIWTAYLHQQDPQREQDVACCLPLT